MDFAASALTIAISILIVIIGIDVFLDKQAARQREQIFLSGYQTGACTIDVQDTDVTILCNVELSTIEQ